MTSVTKIPNILSNYKFHFSLMFPYHFGKNELLLGGGLKWLTAGGDYGAEGFAPQLYS